MYINVDTLEQGIALDPKSLGLSSLSGVRDNRKVKIIPIEGVMPTPATIADGSYPLYTAIYLAANPASPHAAQIAQFMEFLSSDEARKLMRDHDLLPYSDAPTLAAQPPEQQIASVTAKMVSEGLPASEAAKAGVSAVAAAPIAPPPPASVALPTAATPPAHIAEAADVANATVTSSARVAKDPSVKHAEAVAPSNPVVISAGGAVTPVASVLDPNRPGSYTVSRGDTLSKIARKYSLQVSDLRKWNDLKSDTLQVGQVLQLAQPQ